MRGLAKLRSYFMVASLSPPYPPTPPNGGGGVEEKEFAPKERPLV